ncbi:hypothetical protein [Chryseobacterium sp. Bi04]|uniref:hypothetical protein n=1 Tax=Chryseobacterium sp. Bi04 TaxID=2822345 RepID=UPI001DB0CE0E|nr:hypothetical protein [Chryseobacterium sp. Bi04]CAH0213515.1 hypothetical protein SRABI04_02284 [Chryseobacterium sp. Bi04]
MQNSFIKESDESINYFSNFLTHLRFMKSLYSEISVFFTTNTEKQNLHDFYILNDISSLITICHLDLVTNSKNLYLAKSNWEKIFFVKNTFLVIYETINSFHKHGKFLNEKSKLNESISSVFSKVNTDLKDFKKKYKYDTHINKIRNTISGHINDNFEEYYDEIINFDAEKTALMTLDFINIIGSIQYLLTEMMQTIELDKSKISNEKLNRLQEILNSL